MFRPIYMYIYIYTYYIVSYCVTQVVRQSCYTVNHNTYQVGILLVYRQVDARNFGGQQNTGEDARQTTAYHGHFDGPRLVDEPIDQFHFGFGIGWLGWLGGLGGAIAVGQGTGRLIEAVAGQVWYGCHDYT